jgi:WD40 repeat protein
LVATANHPRNPLEARVTLWDWQRGRIEQIEGAGPGNALAFAPSGASLALGRFDGFVDVLDTASGDRLLRFPAGPVDAIAYAPDGKTIATGGDDGTVRLFDARTGEQLLVLRGHTYLVSGVSFSPDGRRLASASPDGVVRVWALDLDDLIRIARHELTRELSDDECRQYLHQPNGCE